MMPPYLIRRALGAGVQRSLIIPHPLHVLVDHLSARDGQAHAEVEGPLRPYTSKVRHLLEGGLNS